MYRGLNHFLTQVMVSPTFRFPVHFWPRLMRPWEQGYHTVCVHPPCYDAPPLQAASHHPHGQGTSCCYQPWFLQFQIFVSNLINRTSKCWYLPRVFWVPRNGRALLFEWHISFKIILMFIIYHDRAVLNRLSLFHQTPLII